MFLFIFPSDLVTLLVNNYVRFYFNYELISNKSFSGMLYKNKKKAYHVFISPKKWLPFKYGK